jgi:CRP-like cAMP-binding protein
MPAGPTKTERIETLGAIPIFSGLSSRSLDKIRKVAGEIDVPAAQVLIQPRTQGSGLYIVEEGTVVVERRGQKIELGPGQYFGELALLAEHTHTARVRAKTPVRCLTINRFDFRRLLEEEPKIAIAMLESLAARFANSLDPS